MSINKIEESISSHMLFVYNNILLQEEAIIDPELVTEISNHIKDLNKYDSLTLVLNTRGGNLASGYKIINMLKGKYNNVNVVVMERCGSTGTFMALAADNLYVSPQAIISPTEPQMDTYDGTASSVSTAVIRNYLENKNKHPDAVEKLDAITYGNYYSAISYFKQLCYNTYGQYKADLIIEYMLDKVNSHQLPLLEDDFKKMGIKILPIPEKIQADIEEQHEAIVKYLHGTNKKNIRYTMVRSNNKTSVFEKQYDENKTKIAEGYFVIEEEKIMKTVKKENARITDILAEGKKVDTAPATYADAQVHWDSYNDSYYHDNYQDRYDDYGDSSTYHDSYRDSIQLDAPKVKQKKVNEKTK